MAFRLSRTEGMGLDMTDDTEAAWEQRVYYGQLLRDELIECLCIGDLSVTKVSKIAYLSEMSGGCGCSAAAILQFIPILQTSMQVKF